MSTRRIVPRKPRKSVARKALEAQLENRQQAVARKIWRNKAEKDIHVTKESGLDPRMPLQQARNLPTNELRRYVKELSSFTSKENQFLRGARGSAILPAQFRELQALDAQFNALAEAHDSAIENLRIPTINRTIGGRREDLERGKDGKPRDRMRGGRRTFESINHRLQDIDNLNGGIEALIEQARAKLEPGYLHTQMVKGRENVSEMLTVAGDDEFLERMNSLDDYQLNILLNETDFMRNAAARYKAKISGNRKFNKVPESEYENAGSNMDVLLDWAANLTRDDSGNITDSATESTNAGTTGTTRARNRANRKGRK